MAAYFAFRAHGQKQSVTKVDTKMTIWRSLHVRLRRRGQEKSTSTWAAIGKNIGRILFTEGCQEISLLSSSHLFGQYALHFWHWFLHSSDPVHAPAIKAAKVSSLLRSMLETRSDVRTTGLKTTE